MKEINIAKLKDGKLEANGESLPIISDYNPQLYGSTEHGQLSIWKIPDTKIPEVAASIAAQILENNVNIFFLQGVSDAQRVELYNKVQENLTDTGSNIQLLPQDANSYKKNGANSFGNMLLFTTPPYSDTAIDPKIQNAITKLENTLPKTIKGQVQLNCSKLADGNQLLLINIDMEGAANSTDLEKFITTSVAQFSIANPQIEIIIGGATPSTLNIPNKKEDGKGILLNAESNLHYFQGAKGSNYKPYIDPNTNLPINNYYREESNVGLFILPAKKNSKPVFHEELKNLQTYNNPHVAHKILYYEKENNESTVTTNETPAAKVERANFLYQGNLQNINTALTNFSKDWILEKRIRDNPFIKARNIVTGDSVYIYPDKVITKCDTLDAFKAALICFCAPPREKNTPYISTFSEEARQKWIQAIQALPQLNIQDPAALVSVATPAPAPRP